MANIVKKPWTPSQGPPELIFKNASVVGVTHASIINGVSLHLKEGRAGKTSHEELPHASKATVVDIHDKFVCPGLIDYHVHLTTSPGSDSMRDLFTAHLESIAHRTAWTAKQMLLRGFTTVRDTAGATYALRHAIADGLVVGPRLFICPSYSSVYVLWTCKTRKTPPSYRHSVLGFSGLHANKVLQGKALSQMGGHGDLRLLYDGDAVKCCGGHTPRIARLCDGVPACLEAARDELRQGSDFLKILVGGGVASPVDLVEMVQFTEDIQAITTSARNLGKIVTAHAYTKETIQHAVDNRVMAIEHANFIDKGIAQLIARKCWIVAQRDSKYSKRQG